MKHLDYCNKTVLFSALRTQHSALIFLCSLSPCGEKNDK